MYFVCGDAVCAERGIPRIGGAIEVVALISDSLSFSVSPELWTVSWHDCISLWRCNVRRARHSMNYCSHQSMCADDKSASSLVRSDGVYGRHTIGQTEVLLEFVWHSFAFGW